MTLMLKGHFRLLGRKLKGQEWEQGDPLGGHFYTLGKK